MQAAPPCANAEVKSLSTEHEALCTPAALELAAHESEATHMKIGIMPPLFSPIATPEFLMAVGAAADDLGFSSIWAPEHVVLFDEYASKYPYAEDGKLAVGPNAGVLDPFNVLAFLAAATKKVRLGTGIALVPQRNPVYTAKQVTTVDRLSNGRIDFGVGIGWLREEFAALGVPWARRGARTEEYLEVMRRLWLDDVSSYEGEFYSLPACRQSPKPIQSPYPPIIFGGESDAALGRVARKGDGWFGFNLTPESAAERIGALEKMLDSEGRKRSEVSISVRPAPGFFTPAHADEFRQLGVEQLILVIGGRSAESVIGRMEAIAAELVTPVAAG